MKNINIRITSILGLIIASLVITFFLGPVQVLAAKAPKVEICHFDADTDLYKKLSVSVNAK